MTHLKNISRDQIKKFIWIFYSLGIVGLGIPWTRAFFIYLVPINYLVSFVVLLVTDRSDQKSRIPFAVIVFVFGFIVEAVGVNTGLIFGDFSFGKSLGVKVFGTPVIIGFNWLMLVYCASIIVSQFTDNKYFISFLATILIVVYDMVLEGPAGVMGMWSWDWENIPMMNFLSWFIIAWMLNGALQLAKIKLENPVAGTLFSAQFVCFLFLNLIFFVEQAFVP